MLGVPTEDIPPFDERSAHNHPEWAAVWYYAGWSPIAANLHVWRCGAGRNGKSCPHTLTLACPGNGPGCSCSLPERVEHPAEVA